MVKNGWPRSRFVCGIWQSASSSTLVVLVKLGSVSFNPRLPDLAVYSYYYYYFLPVNSLALSELNMEGTGMILRYQSK